MIKLVIDNIDGYYYEVHDKENHRYRFHIEFYDLKQKPSIGDYFFVNSKLLNQQNIMLNFGSITSTYGRKIINEEDPDLFILICNNEKIYLKRLYG